MASYTPEEYEPTNQNWNNAIFQVSKKNFLYFNFSARRKNIYASSTYENVICQTEMVYNF